MNRAGDDHPDARNPGREPAQVAGLAVAYALAGDEAAAIRAYRELTGVVGLACSGHLARRGDTA